MSRKQRCVAIIACGTTILLTACAGVARYVPSPSDPSPQPLIVLVWIDSRPDLPAPTTLEGCQIWAPKGVVCAQTADDVLADIRVYADDTCVQNEDGRRTLATAYQGGRIVMQTRCFKTGEDFDVHAYRAVVGHEVGHQLGIWQHVPKTCDTPPRAASSDYTPVCGQALMNPLYDKDVHFMTPVDARAFDGRQRDFAVVDFDGVTHTHVDARRPLCTYEAW